jgi:hypothetical protein
MHPTRALSAILTFLLLFSCHPVFSADETAVDAAIDRGLAWIMAHPATCQDGGFLDIVDEGLFYLTIRRLGSGKMPDALHERAFEDCISRLEASPEFERRLKKQDKTLFEQYHLLLATYLIETVRKPAVSHDRVIAEARRTLANSGSENQTFRLTVALLIQHLGATPPVSMAELLDASLVNRVTQRDVSKLPGQPPHRSTFQRPLAYYALVHEVAALTDFGRLPPSPWLIERRSRIGRILQDGALRAMVSAHVDLLAEMLLCNHMLDLAMTGELLAGVDFLVASQHADGSWGEQVTSPHTNRVRHAVQTATAALLAYKTTSRAH